MPFLRRRRTPPLTKKETLKAFPIRNPNLEWYKEEGKVVIKVPVRRDWIGKFVSLIFSPPPIRNIVLDDEIGSLIWELCDGNHTFEQILEVLTERYKITRREAEVAVGAFLKELGKRRFVVFAVRKEESKNGEKTRQKNS